MTEDEEYEYLMLLAQAGAQDEEEPEVSRGESFARGARQGATLGFADEAQAAVGNLLDRVTGTGREQAEILGEEFDSKQNYRGLRDAVRAEEAAAREANPGTYLMGEMAGSLAVPAGGGGGVLRAAGRGALEGAAYGAGASEGETAGEIAADAALGGVTAGALSGAMRGVAGVGNVLTRNNAPDIDMVNAGVPLQQSTGTMGRLYNQTVGRIYGADRILREQSQPFLDAADAAVDAAKRQVDDVADTAREASIAQRNKLRIDRAAQNMLDAQKAETKGLSRAAKSAREAADRRAREDFQRLAINEAIPESMPRELADEIRNMTPRDADEALREYFKASGFADVKANAFDLDNDLARNIQDKIDSDPNMAILMRDVLGEGARLQDALGYRPTALEEGQRLLIDGEALMAMRNAFATRANGAPSQTGRLMREIADEFDAEIKRQLPADAVRRFEDDLAKWGVRDRLSVAVHSARKKPESFGPAEWMSKRAPNRAPLEEEALGAIEGVATRKRQLPVTQGVIKEQGALAEREIKTRAAGLQRAAKAAAARKATEQKRSAASALAEAKRIRKEMPQPPGNASPLSSILTMGLVGSMTGLGASGLLGGPAGGALGVAAGAYAGRGMARPGFQRMLGGQSGLQRAVQKVGRDERAQAVARLMRQGLSRAAALKAVEEAQ